MEEKRNIQISLKEAREWYNSGNSFKRELALKAYKEIFMFSGEYTFSFFSYCVVNRHT